MDVRQAWDQGYRGRGWLKTDRYHEPQHRHLAAFQGRPVTMLEVGVLGGGSLDLWRHYLGPQATLVGLDIDPACKRFDSPADGVHVRIGDQGDAGFLADVAAEFGPFDIASDDGGHMASQQVTTFRALWPHVSPGGVYICEDSFSAYDPDFVDQRPTFVDVAKGLVDELHAWCGPEQPTEFTRCAGSVCFYFGLVVIEKAAAEVTPPRLMLRGDDGIDFLPLPSVRFE